MANESGASSQCAGCRKQRATIREMRSELQKKQAHIDSLTDLANSLSDACNALGIAAFDRELTDADTLTTMAARIKELVAIERHQQQIQEDARAEAFERDLYD